MFHFNALESLRAVAGIVRFPDTRPGSVGQAFLNVLALTEAASAARSHRLRIERADVQAIRSAGREAVLDDEEAPKLGVVGEAADLLEAGEDRGDLATRRDADDVGAAAGEEVAVGQDRQEVGGGDGGHFADGVAGDGDLEDLLLRLVGDEDGARCGDQADDLLEAGAGGGAGDLGLDGGGARDLDLGHAAGLGHVAAAGEVMFCGPFSLSYEISRIHSL